MRLLIQYIAVLIQLSTPHYQEIRPVLFSGLTGRHLVTYSKNVSSPSTLIFTKKEIGKSLSGSSVINQNLIMINGTV
ncbi:hypothetical protein D3C72_2130870 [compost metagenome]